MSDERPAWQAEPCRLRCACCGGAYEGPTRRRPGCCREPHGDAERGVARASPLQGVLEPTEERGPWLAEHPADAHDRHAAYLVHGERVLVEVKAKRGTLTADQRGFHARFPVTVVRTIDDIAALHGTAREETR